MVRTMAKRGYIKAIPVRSLLLWADETGYDGRITCQRDLDKRSLYFESGKISGARSSMPKEGLLWHLIRFGELNSGKAEKLGGYKEVENILLTEDLIEYESLMKAKKELAFRISVNLFSWFDGHFLIFPHVETPKNLAVESINVSGIVKKGAGVRSIYRDIVRVSPNMMTPVSFSTNPKVAMVVASVGAKERGILKLIDGKRTFDEIVTESEMEDHETVEFLVKWYQDGMLEMPLRDDVFKLAEDWIEEGRYYDAAEKIKAYTTLNPKDTIATNKLVELVQVLGRDVKEKIGTLLTVPELTEKAAATDWRSLNLDPRTGFFLTRIDGVVNIKQLLSYTDLDKNDVLIIIYRLLQSGLIELRVVIEEEAEAPAETMPVDAETQKMLEEKLFSLRNANLYEVLEVAPFSDKKLIKRQFIKMVKMYHPDKFQMTYAQSKLKDVVEDIFTKVQKAYETLMDDKARAKYDQRTGISIKKATSKEQARKKAKGQFQYKLGQRLLDKRNYMKAIEFFKSAIELDTEEPLYFAKLGEAYMKSPRGLDQGLQACNKAIELDPRNGYYYETLGAIQIKKGDLTSGKENLVRALQLNPANESALAMIKSFDPQFQLEKFKSPSEMKAELTLTHRFKDKLK